MDREENFFTASKGRCWMSEERCPHCGSELPVVRDAFCVTCGESLDELPDPPRTPHEQEIFRKQVEQEAKENMHFLYRLGRLFRW